MARAKNGSPTEVISGRLATCRREMARRGVQAYLITRHMDSFYLTGFTGEDSAIIVTRRTVHLISDGRFDEAIDEEAPWTRKWMRRGTLVDEIGRVCRRLKFDRLSVQTDGMDVETHQALRASARPTRIVKAPPLVNGMRRCKDGEELKMMRRAISIAQDAFIATRRTIRIGQTEEQIAARLEYEMRKRGAIGPAFSTICAVGANASRPHARAGSRQVKGGSAILIDWGANCGFYRSDLTRVLFMGRIPPKLGRLYKIVLAAQQAAIETIRPGERMCDVDAVARKVIADSGYGKQFGHGLGHGLGLNVHEPPSLSWRSRERLTEGMVVTVEPGIYLRRLGGVRIEDDVLVTSTGCRVLSDLSKDLKGAVV